MAKLLLSNNQKTQIVDPIDANLQKAMGDGVEYGGGPTAYLDPFLYFLTLSAGNQTTAKNSYRLFLSALVKTLNFDQVGLGTAAAPVTVTLAKITPGGANGSLTIVGGLVVAKVDPT